MNEGKDIEKGRLIKGGFGKDHTPAEQGYTGEGVAPTMKEVMLTKAMEMEEYINSQRTVSKEVVEAAKMEWEHMDEDGLLRAANQSDTILWMRSPGTYLALAKALRKKASE